MARASNSNILLNMGTLFLLLGLCTCNLINNDCDTSNNPLVVYVFRRSPNNTNPTFTYIYPPGFNGTGFSSTPPVGVSIVLVGDNPIKRSDSEQSLIIGYQRNIRTLDLQKDDRLRSQVTGVLDFQILDMQGTIEYAGVQTTGANIPREELAITGGTAYFHVANGYIQVSVVRNIERLVVLRQDIFLCE